MKQAVIFDWDGVIADSLPLFWDVYQHVFQKYARTLPVADVAAFRLWYQPRWERNYIDSGFSEEELPDVLCYAESCVEYSQVPLFAGAVDCFTNLATHVPIAIASTTHAPRITGRLKAASLDHHFTAVIGGEDGGSDKIERYKRAADALGIDPRNIVAVGDTVLDVECSRHWGMRTVGVTYGWSDPKLVAAAHPDRLVDHPSKLEAAVRGLFDEMRRATA